MYKLYICLLSKGLDLLMQRSIQLQNYALQFALLNIINTILCFLLSVPILLTIYLLIIFSSLLKISIKHFYF